MKRTCIGWESVRAGAGICRCAPRVASFLIQRQLWPKAASSCCRITGLAVVTAVFAGCAAGPDYSRPDALAGTHLLPAAFSSEGSSTNHAPWKTAEPSAHLPRGAWWQIFGDPALDQLEQLATGGNQQLALSLARFEQARAIVGLARSEFFPMLSATPSYTRQRTSQNSIGPGEAAGVSRSFGTFSLPLDASWEPDLWGRVRRQTEAARARLEASAEDLEAAKLALQAEVAGDYFMIRAVDAELALLQSTVQAYQRSLELTQNRRKGGIASDLDVSQAETQLKAAQAQIPLVGLERAKLRDALAALCGENAIDFQVNPSSAVPEALPAVPVAVPSELLERRPDIAAAERRMAAANAEVGVARTAFYPRVTFHGLAGLQSIDAGTLFNWPSRFWAVGPSLELPIFTGGRNRAQLARAQAAYRETVAGYRQTVLTAFQDVEDQLAAQRLLNAELEAELGAMTAARRTLDIANNRYKAGLVTYLEVATAQNAALARERTVVRLRAERLAASAGLAKAMGGGWGQ